MFGLCKEATEVALIIIVLVIFIGFKVYKTGICDVSIMTIFMVLVIALIVSGVAATYYAQRDHDINMAIESSLDKNYIGYTNLNTKEKTFIFNNKQFSYEFDYDKKQLVVFDAGQVVDGVYIDGVQNYRKSDNSKLDDTSPQNAN